MREVPSAGSQWATMEVSPSLYKLVTEKVRLPYDLSKLHTESKMPTTYITECELDIII